MTRTFTGWHMTALLVGFFAIVISVNLMMARFATRTFSGVVVENSYLASQSYNRWLEAADRQAKLGWIHAVSLDERRHVTVGLTHQGARLPIEKAYGFAIHPLGVGMPIQLSFTSSRDDAMRSEQSLPPGRWRIRLTLQSNGQSFKIDEPMS